LAVAKLIEKILLTKRKNVNKKLPPGNYILPNPIFIEQILEIVYFFGVIVYP
jgi:hypothetical protein